MRSVAALMEAFLNPSIAVVGQTLEVTVQMVLDFIDDLVSKMTLRFFFSVFFVLATAR